MEPQNQNHGAVLKIGLSVVAGLVIGGIGGYFFGSYDTIRSINKQIEEQQAEDALSAPVNVLGDVETNPLQGVKINPFE